MKKRTVVIVIAAVWGVMLCTLAFAARPFIETFTVRLNKTYYLQVQRQWKQRMEEVGPEQAYVELKRKLANSSTEVAHGVTHVFGELLYEQKGLEGFKVCDASFNYACYHGFITWAVNYEGTPVLEKLNARCSELFGAHDTFCRHGIGHGIFEYMGPEKIEDAFAACDGIGSTSYAGCYNGVMMQFVSNEGYSTARLDPAHPYDVCLKLSSPHRPACYFQTAYWWAWKKRSDQRALSEYCGALSGEERTACFLGAGKSLTEFSGYDPDRSSRLCAGFRAADERSLCESGAAWVFMVLKRDAGALCRHGDPASDEACLATAARAGEDRPQ